MDCMRKDDEGAKVVRLRLAKVGFRLGITNKNQVASVENAQGNRVIIKATELAN